jgi:trehalose/maltose transport system substrate-binding protein
MRNLVAVAVGALALGLASVLAIPARGAEVAILCGEQAEEFALCREGAEAWARQSGNTVKVLPAPERSDERYFSYLDRLDRRDPGVDVLQVDIVWPGALAPHLVDLTPSVPAEVLGAHLPGILAADTVDGRLVAVPWFTDAGLLYYRRDLLERHGVPVPETWGQLGEAALAVQEAERAAGDGDLWGLVFQGAAYEGLTCNALEWVSAYGATLLDAEGGVAVDDPRAAFALGRSPPGSARSSRPGSPASTRRTPGAASSSATPCSCATGPTPGRCWRRRTAPCAARWGWRPCPGAASAGGAPPPWAAGSSPSPSTRRCSRRRSTSCST